MISRYLDLFVAGGIIALSTLGLSFSHYKIGQIHSYVERSASELSTGHHSYRLGFEDLCLGTLRISSVVNEQSVISGKGNLNFIPLENSETDAWNLSFTLKFNALHQLHSGELKLSDMQDLRGDPVLKLLLSSVRPIKADLTHRGNSLTASFEGPLWLRPNEDLQLGFISGSPLYLKNHKHLTRWWSDSGLSLERTDQDCNQLSSAIEPPRLSLEEIFAFSSF